MKRDDTDTDTAARALLSRAVDELIAAGDGDEPWCYRAEAVLAETSAAELLHELLHDDMLVGVQSRYQALWDELRTFLYPAP